MRNERAAPRPEFSRVARAETVREGCETVERVEANEEERRALAERLGLIALPRLAVVARLTRRGESIRVVGRFDADVVQACVATLEPVPARVEDGFTVLLVPEDDSELVPGSIVDVEADEEEDEDVLVDGRIDLGELVAQYLSLAIDPYPRAPGVEFEPHIEHGEGDGEDSKPSPFAALAKPRRPS